MTLQVQCHQWGVGSWPGPHQDGHPGEEACVSPDWFRLLVWQTLTSCLSVFLSCSHLVKAPWGSVSERKSSFYLLLSTKACLFCQLFFFNTVWCLTWFILDFFFVPGCLGFWETECSLVWWCRMKEQEDNSWIVVVKSSAMCNIHRCWLFLVFFQSCSRTLPWQPVQAQTSCFLSIIILISSESLFTLFRRIISSFSGCGLSRKM